MDQHEFRPAPEALRLDPRCAGAAEGGSARRADQGATAIELLIRALAIAQAVVRRSERQYIAAVRDHSPAVAAAALEHANDAKIHVDRISERIGELGGETDVSDLTPDAAITCKPGEARPAPSLCALIGRHLATERDTIVSYREIAAFFGTFDPPTRALIDDIASDAEQRARELAALRSDIPNF